MDNNLHGLCDRMPLQTTQGILQRCLVNAVPRHVDSPVGHQHALSCYPLRPSANDCSLHPVQRVTPMIRCNRLNTRHRKSTMAAHSSNMELLSQSDTDVEQTRPHMKILMGV